jgi:hypothetical protein
MRGRLRSVPIVLAILAVPTAVLAVDVRGSLTVASDLPSLIPAPTDAQRLRARYWEEWNGVVALRQPRLDVARELAVVLTGTGPAADGEQPPYRLHNGSLSPATMIVRAGTALQIRNEDGLAYELFADGNDEFGPISTAPGNVRPITIASPGNWPVRDRSQPHVQGHLHALPDLVARAFLESNGNYSFRGVAPGSYRLRVFHGARELASQEVNVVEGSALQVPAIALSAATEAAAAAAAAAAAPAAPAAEGAPAAPAAPAEGAAPAAPASP